MSDRESLSPDAEQFSFASAYRSIAECALKYYFELFGPLVPLALLMIVGSRRGDSGEYEKLYQANNLMVTVSSFFIVFSTALFMPLLQIGKRSQSSSAEEPLLSSGGEGQGAPVATHEHRAAYLSAIVITLVAGSCFLLIKPILLSINQDKNDVEVTQSFLLGLLPGFLFILIQAADQKICIRSAEGDGSQAFFLGSCVLSAVAAPYVVDKMLDLSQEKGLMVGLGYSGVSAGQVLLFWASCYYNKKLVPGFSDVFSAPFDLEQMHKAMAFIFSSGWRWGFMNSGDFAGLLCVVFLAGALLLPEMVVVIQAAMLWSALNYSIADGIRDYTSSQTKAYLRDSAGGVDPLSGLPNIREHNKSVLRAGFGVACTSSLVQGLIFYFLRYDIAGLLMGDEITGEQRSTFFYLIAIYLCGGLADSMQAATIGANGVHDDSGRDAVQRSLLLTIPVLVLGYPLCEIMDLGAVGLALASELGMVASMFNSQRLLNNSEQAVLPLRC